MTRNRSPLAPDGLRIDGYTVYFPNGEKFTFATRDAAWQAYKKAQWEPHERDKRSDAD